jgi:tol-pal system protein YbgF
MTGLFKKSTLWLLLILTACANDIGFVKKSDIDALNRESAQTRKDIAELKRDMSDLRENIPEEESLAAIRQSQASLYTQVSELLREVQTLSGRFDENKYFIDRFLKETSSDIEVIQSRLDTISASFDEKALEAIRSRIKGIDSGISKLEERIAALESVPKKEEVPKKVTPEAAYEEALKTYKEERYAEARQKMGALIKDYPGHKLSGNAQFWIGETYYAEKSFDDAILAYEDVLQKYRDNPKIPAAMLKQAYSFIELEDKKAARGILKELMQRYPESEQATAAKESIKKLSD